MADLLLQALDWEGYCLEVMANDDDDLILRVYRPGADSSRYAVALRPDQELQLLQVLAARIKPGLAVRREAAHA